jgi:hypothetical protein
MEVDLKKISYEELINLYNAMCEFIEFLETEENSEVESRKK